VRRQADFRGTLMFRFVVLCAVCATACAGPRPRSQPDDFVIAFSSCLNQNYDSSFWSTIGETKPNLFLFTGDTVYADTLDLSVKRAAFARLRREPYYTTFKKYTRVLAVWDDHDYGYNDAGGSYRHKREMQKIFLDAFDEPRDSQRRAHEGIYTSEEIILHGRVIQIIVLDARYFRSDWKRGPRVPPYSRTYLEDDREKSTFLGDAQWQWLITETQKKADLRILVSSTPVLSDDYRGERWGAFPRERARLYETLRAASGKWLIVTGDRHFGQISEIKGVLRYPLVEVMASGMNTVWEEGAQEPDRYRVGQTVADINFGLLRINAKAGRVAYSVHGGDGRAQLAGELEF
jgi:alkaline phosphatase D